MSPTPLKNMTSSDGMMTFPTEWKNKQMFQSTNQNYNGWLFEPVKVSMKAVDWSVDQKLHPRRRNMSNWLKPLLWIDRHCKPDFTNSFTLWPIWHSHYLPLLLWENLDHPISPSSNHVMLQQTVLGLTNSMYIYTLYSM